MLSSNTPHSLANPARISLPRPSRRLSFCFVILIAVIWGYAHVGSAAKPRPISPGSIVEFPQGGIVCLTQEALLKITMHSLNHEKTEVAAMQMSEENPNAPCTMLVRQKKYKVLAVEYNNPNMPDLGLLEIVGNKAKAENGGWTYSLGAQVVGR
jgi:hypothetical protein